MRTPLLVAVAAILTMTTAGCAGADEDSGLGGRRSLKRAAPAEESDNTADDEHDPTQSAGETSQDPGNPNATTKPTAPTTPGTSAPEFALQLASATPTVDLGQSTTLDVTIQPKGAFTGKVDLTVSGLPTGATATPTSVNVTGAPATAKIAIKADLTAPVTAPNGSIPLVITARAGTATATANANFKISPRVTLTIPVNVDALRGAAQVRPDYWLPNDAPQSLRTQAGNGIVVTVFNADSKAHIVHGPGGQFPHGNTGAPIQPNAFEMNNGAVRTRTLQVGANVTAYLHDGSGGQGASFRIQVTAGQ